jgi:hypothetical protein
LDSTPHYENKIEVWLFSEVRDEQSLLKNALQT